MKDKTPTPEVRTEATGGPESPARDTDTLSTGDKTTMSFLVQVAEELNSTLDLDRVLHKVAEKVKRFVDYDSFGILLLDPLGQELRIRFGLGFPPEVAEHWRFGLGQGIVGTAAKTRRPVRVEDVGNDPRYINALTKARSELAIPLVAKNRTIGVLDVQSRQPSYYTEVHQRLLTFLAGHLANAIENARLYEKLREQARSLSLLNEAGRELTSILDQDILLSKVAELVKRIVDYQLFSVMLWNEETQLLEHAFSLKFDERFRQKTGFPLGYGITGTSASLRKPLRVPNVHLDPRFVRCGHDVEVRSELVAPLVFKDRLIGVVDLESIEYNAFTEQHEDMLSTLASYIAVAIENSRLYDKVRQDEKRLADDLATAREIQKGLLPEGVPDLPGLEVGSAYEPATMLGGDFYDFLPHGEGRLAIAVGDVAGKATAAALQGSLAIGLLREHMVSHPCGPAEMLVHMNRQLHLPRLDNRFVAMLFAIYDTDSQVLTVANAGFTRPLLVRDGQIDEIHVQGIPLGLIPGTQYEEISLQLQKNDLLVFCSDGVQESVDRRGEEFSQKRLRALLVEQRENSAQKIADTLLQVTEQHAVGNREPADDRTVVVLKVTR